VRNFLRQLTLGFLVPTVLLTACGGGGSDGPSDYYTAKIQVQKPGSLIQDGAVLSTCGDKIFATAAECAAGETACRAAYPFQPVPSNAAYVCTHVIKQ
jgi:hypothetical protein